MSLLPAHWYYNTESGQLTQGNNLENLGNNLVGGAGWHELNVPGSATQAQAAKEAVREFPKGKAPTSQGVANPSADAGRAAAQTVGGNPLAFLGDIANFFGDLSQASTWIRIAKVLVGGVLLIVGAARLTGASKVVDTAAKAAPLLAA